MGAKAPSLFIMGKNVKKFLEKYQQGSRDQDAAFYKMFRKAANEHAGVNGQRFSEMEKELSELKKKVRDVVVLRGEYKDAPITCLSARILDRDINGMPSLSSNK